MATYQIKYGDTLSSIAKKNNTTVAALQALNNITNPDKIYSGKTIQLSPQGSPATVAKPLPVPTVQSSDMARNAALEAETKLKNIQNTTQNNTNKLSTTTTNKTKAPVVINESKTDLQMKLDLINKSAASEVKSISSMFDNMSRTMDANSNNLITSIKNTFARRINQMEELNVATEKGVQAAGYVSGRARYAPELQTSILSNEERAGIDRVMDLETQEQQLIAEAQVASDGKKMQMLFNKMDALGKVHDSKLTAIADLNKEVIEMEKLNIQIAQERRQQIKDDLANNATIAQNLASGLEAAFTGDPEVDNAMVLKAAEDYGIDPNFLNQAIANAREEKSKSLPSDIREYDEMVARGQYKGSFLQYQRAKAAANKISSGTEGTKGLTRDDVSRYDLPVELVGKSPKGIIEDLSVEKVPSWFKVSQARAGHISPDATPAEWQAQWNSFRNSGDMEVFKKTIDINKVDSSSAFNWAAMGGLPSVPAEVDE